MDKGERFTLIVMLMTITSYQTPFEWWQDSFVFGILLLIGTLINARENRVW